MLWGFVLVLSVVFGCLFSDRFEKNILKNAGFVFFVVCLFCVSFGFMYGFVCGFVFVGGVCISEVLPFLPLPLRLKLSHISRRLLSFLPCRDYPKSRGFILFGLAF